MTLRIICLLPLMVVLGIAQAQKGEKSLAAGPLLSIPLEFEMQGDHLKTGLGAELVGQYNISNKSALQLKATLASWRVKDSDIGYETGRLTCLTVQGGYKYLFQSSGFYLNGLVGMDLDLSDGFTSASFTLGTGKRLLMADRFVDIGIDLVGADAESRLNFKVLFSIFQ